jgi:hypothetical protein
MPIEQVGGVTAMLTSEAARRLIALLRILECRPSGYGVVGDDAILDA